MPGMVVRRSCSPAHGRGFGLDTPVERRGLCVDGIDVGQGLGRQEGVVVLETTGQSLTEVRHLRAGFPDGEVGQHHRVAFTGDKGFDHGAGRHAQCLGQHE